MDATDAQVRWTAGHDFGEELAGQARRRARLLYGLNDDLAADWLAGVLAGVGQHVRAALPAGYGRGPGPAPDPAARPGGPPDGNNPRTGIAYNE